MAAKSAIGIRRETAIREIQEATASLFREAVDLPTQHKDSDLLHVLQLETIADYLKAQQARKRAKA